MAVYGYRTVAILAALVSGGCLTVGMDNEFVEVLQTYRADGSVESVAETRWTQNARGGLFTDIEQTKQDTMYSYRGPDGETYDIGQGSGAGGVSGAGQTEAFTATMRAVSEALSAAFKTSLVPLPVP